MAGSINVKIEKVFFISISIFTIIALTISYFQRKEIEQYGVYVIGKVEEVTMAKTGRNFKCIYLYKDSLYRTYFTELGLPLKNGSLVIFKISKRKPSLWEKYLEFKIPPCLTFNSAPKEGWRYLNDIKCN